MQELINAKLFGNGLISIHEPYLVERYNACLEDIGLPKTNLTHFHIDGVGWSPQIAEEKDDAYYLSHNGVANPYAIILTPQQEDRPVFFPFYSFDRDIMRVVFSTFKNHINDLTTLSGIWIDIDQEITRYQAPQDLLMIDSIILRFYTPARVMKAAREQRALVRRLYDEPRAWANNNLLEAIIESKKTKGDLRYRSIDMPDTPYSHLQTFYTRAFEGIFVIRSMDKSQSFLVFEKGQPVERKGALFPHLEFNITDEKLIDLLLKDGSLIYDNEHTQDQLNHLQRVMDHEVVDAMIAANMNVELNFFKEDKKRIITTLSRQGLLSEAYFTLEQLVKQVKAGRTMKLSKEKGLSRLLFLRPTGILEGREQDVLYKLLVKLFPNDVLNLYTYHKDGFYEKYQSWPPLKRNWSIDCIKSYKTVDTYI